MNHKKFTTAIPCNDIIACSFDVVNGRNDSLVLESFQGFVFQVGGQNTFNFGTINFDLFITVVQSFANFNPQEVARSSAFQDFDCSKLGVQFVNDVCT